MAGYRDDGIVHRHPHSTSVGARLQILIIAWLYVTLMVALATKGAVAGSAFFLVVGCSPLVLYGWLVLRRRRAMRSPDSTLESEVKATDDGDA